MPESFEVYQTGNDPNRVTAETGYVDSLGNLVFTTGQVVVAAFAPGNWKKFAKVTCLKLPTKGGSRAGVSGQES